MEIAGLTALVTGGASGLGEATARFLASKGAKVIVADFDGDRAAVVAKDIGGFAGQCDVCDEGAVEEAIAAGGEHFGEAPRIVVNCAGIGLAGRIVGRDGQTSLSLFRKVIEVNLIGTYTVMTLAIKAMMGLDPNAGGERGVVINTASAAYEDGQIGQSAYAASKGGIASMCLPAARELGRAGIRVMAIAPGLFRTPMMETLPEETVAQISKTIPFPDRLGEPGEFAQMAGHIAENAYLNGTVIRLDGSLRLPPR